MTFKTPFISEPIVFEENRIKVLVIENPDVLTNIVIDLLLQKNGMDGEAVFSSNYKPYDVKKYIEIITDPFMLDLNSRKIINETAKHINKVATTEKLNETNFLRGSIDCYLDELFQNILLPLKIDNYWTMDNLIKSMGLCYETEKLSLSEKLIEYFNISEFLFDTKCFVLLNIKQYINKNTLELFYKNIINSKQKILILESYNTYSLECEDTTILDNDLCIL